MQLTELKFVERSKIDTPNTQIHDRCFSWVSTGSDIRLGNFTPLCHPRDRLTISTLCSIKSVRVPYKFEKGFIDVNGIKLMMV
jgi:hypothetical protein